MTSIRTVPTRMWFENGEITHGPNNFPSQPQNFQLQLPPVNQSVVSAAGAGSLSILLIIGIVALAPVGA